MGSDPVWGNQTDSFALSHWAFVIIVATAIVYDLLLHKLTHYLQRAAHVHRDTEKASYALRPAKTYLKIWVRFQTEIMVLGCLAFTIWVANQCGAFDAVAEIKGGSTGPGWDVVRAYRDAVARRKACKNECADAEKGVDDAHRRLLGAAAENEGSSVPLYLSMCPTRWPSDGAVILHVFERIHFVLFVTAFFYFFSLAVIYFLFVRRIKNYGYVEAAMAKARERSKADVEGASAELSTAEIELTALSDKPSMKRVQYHVLAMRSFVMSHAPEGSNADGRFLSVRAFLQRTTTADIDALISFPVTTFAIVGLGGLILAVSSTYHCDPEYLLDSIWWALWQRHLQALRGHEAGPGPGNR